MTAAPVVEREIRRALNLLDAVTADYGSEDALGLAELALERALAALPADDGWRPISEAPKDGTWLLGWAAKDSAPYRMSWGRNHRGELAWCTSFASLVDGYITHFRPLPAPPVEAARG